MSNSVPGIAIQQVRDLLRRVQATSDANVDQVVAYINFMENIVVPLGFVLQPSPPDPKAYAAEIHAWAMENRQQTLQQIADAE